MIIEHKTCAGVIDYPAVVLRHTVKLNERAIQKMDEMADCTQRIGEVNTDTTWSRLAYACQHEAMALRWTNRALQERIDGGPGVNDDTDVFLTVTETMVSLAQNWRGP